jgi:asparagine synthase (glutamine-hydrolysing)
MGGLACAVSFDSAIPVNPAVRVGMVDAASHRGTFADQAGPWGFVGAYRWPGEAGVLCVRHGVICAAHGSLFGVPEARTCDAIVDVYLASGLSGLRDLDGEIAFVVFDSSSKTLFLCRDTFGARPLFFWRDRSSALVASQPTQLLASGLVPARPCRARFREILGLAQADRETTVFEGIRRVLPSRIHVLASDGREESSRTWHPPMVVDWSIPYEDAVREFPRVLAECVGRRPWVRPVLTLSGGLDSTALAAMVTSGAGLRERFRVNGSIAAATLSFPGFACDEKGAAGSVARRLGLSHLVFDATATGPIRGASLLQGLYDQPVPGSSGYQLLVDVPFLGALGYSSYCLGIGGDDFWMGERSWSFDAIARCRLSRHSGGPGLMPHEWWRAIQVAAARGSGVRRWLDRIHPRGVARSRSPRATKAPSRRFDTVSWARAFERTEAVYSGSLLEFVEAVCSHWRLTPQYPFLDRAMADFAYRLPPGHIRRGGVFKGMVRDAVRSLLPDSVVNNLKKVDFSSVVDQEIRLLTETVFGDKASFGDWGWLTREGICDKPEVEALFGHCRLTSWRDWPILSVESWIRHRGRALDERVCRGQAEVKPL